MKRFGLTMLAVAALCVAAAKPGAAQAQGTTIGVGLGLTLPMGDYGDNAVWGDKAGFHFGVGAGFALGSAPVRLRVEGSYTQTSHDAAGTGNTKLLGGMLSFVYPFQTAGQIKPYVLAGVGAYNIKESVSDTSKTSVAFGGGLGIRFPMSSMSVFVEARYLSAKAFDVTFAQLPITAGISFPVGGKRM